MDQTSERHQDGFFSEAILGYVRCTDFAPVLGRRTDLEEVINNWTSGLFEQLLMQEKKKMDLIIVVKFNLTATKKTP